MVITNVLMGGMGGLERIKKLRQLRSNTKIIAISGGGADITPETVLATAKKMGADGSGDGRALVSIVTFGQMRRPITGATKSNLWAT
ncbi:MAG: response regulator [Rhodospirillales bacterium]|nr:response regulator [Rhodospirillales bacterium]